MVLALALFGCGGHSRGNAPGGGSEATEPAAAVSVEGCDFDDSLVAQAVATALGGSTSVERLATVKSLTANRASSLAGIECLPNLEELVSTNGTLVDVSPLALLPHLQRVQLARNKIADLSPFSANLEMEELKAASNDLHSLDGLTLPPPHGCPQLVLDFNPLDDADVAFACDAGWPVTWGGPTLQDIQSCNTLCLR